MWLARIAALAAHAHDNHVTFPGASSIIFNETMHSITSGQPYSGTTTSGNDMDVEAGREGSAGPAADFCNGLSVLNTMGLDTSWPHATQMPKDLNFMVKGTLSFTFPSGKTHHCEDFHIGQGRTKSSNNWWIGSKHCTSIPTTSEFVCKTLSGKCDVSIHMGNDDHSFEVRETATSAPKATSASALHGLTLQRFNNTALAGPGLTSSIFPSLESIVDCAHGSCGKPSSLLITGRIAPTVAGKYGFNVTFDPPLPYPSPEAYAR